MKLHTETFLSAKFDNDVSPFFVEKPDRKLFLFQNLPGYIHSYSSPQSVWKSPGLDWKKNFMKLHTENFISAKFDNDMSISYVDNPYEKFFLF